MTNKSCETVYFDTKRFYIRTFTEKCYTVGNQRIPELLPAK